ncbi:MAG: phosphopantothenoylcysteine decarboxylase [Endomicrobium sp.]|jgi:phosphopantothenoylcysteine synthetase/decarboxylase|nr:phosphopantothenoylcysteine decarboxylase [Endomicrobium sp.]
MSLKNKNIILGICGGIAAYKSCDIIRGLVKCGAHVECILTRSGAKFITPLTLRTLSKNKIYLEMFDISAGWDIDHISLAKKADVVLIAPATADIISRLASGRADDLLSCTVLASNAEIVICPSMNSNMLNHKATQNNMDVLKSYGYKFIISEEGELACGDFGSGRLACTETIISEVSGLFS